MNPAYPELCNKVFDLSLQEGTMDDPIYREPVQSLPSHI